MKKLIILAIVLMASVAQAEQVRFAWDANAVAPEGYRLFVTYGEEFDYGAPLMLRAHKEV